MEGIMKKELYIIPQLGYLKLDLDNFLCQSYPLTIEVDEYQNMGDEEI